MGKLEFILCLALVGCGPSKQEIEKMDTAEKTFHTAGQNSLNDLDAKLLEARVRLLTVRHGESAGEKYRLCHTYPPTTKQHKLACERLDKQLAQDEAIAEKHPW